MGCRPPVAVQARVPQVWPHRHDISIHSIPRNGAVRAPGVDAVISLVSILASLPLIVSSPQLEAPAQLGSPARLGSPAQVGPPASVGSSIGKVALELFDPGARLRTTLTHRNGLPTNNVTALCYDGDGFLMVGTRGGLAKFDGITFESLLANDNDGLEGDSVLTLYTGANGDTWVGTKRTAPTIYSDGEFRALCDRSVVHSVRQVLPARDGAHWLVGHVLARAEGGEVSALPLNPDRPEIQPNAALEDESGKLWVVTDSGVFVGGTSGFERVDERAASAILADFSGAPWCQSPDGLLYQPLVDAAQPIDLGLGGVIVDELVLSDRRRLLATGRGAFLLEPGHPDGTGLRVSAVKGTMNSVPEVDAITCFLREGENDFWVGTSDNGVDHLEHCHSVLAVLPDRRAKTSVSDVYSISGNEALVFGKHPTQVHRLDSEGHATEVSLAGSARNLVHDVATNPHGTWVATEEGVATLDGDRLLLDPGWTSPCDHLVVHPDGSIWGLFESTLRCVVSPDGAPLPSEQGESFRVPMDWVQGIFAYQDTIAVNDNVDVLKLDRQLARWVTLGTLDSVKVRDVREGSGGEIWISTYGQGLRRLLPSGKLDSWSRDDGLPDWFLSWLGPTDESGHLWVSANSGVIRINVPSLDAYLDGKTRAIEAVTFSSPESSGSTGAELGGSLLAFPTLKGVSILDRSSLPLATSPPKVLFQSPLVDGIPLGEGAEPIGKANVVFKFTAPVFPSAVAASFQYRLSGEGEKWAHAGSSRSVLYPALRPGAYTLEVRARTPTTQWSSPVKSDPLVVRRHWFQHPTTWFMSAVAGVLLILWFVRRETSYLTQQNSALSQEVHHRLEIEGQLRSSEERFRQLFHTAPSAIVSWSPSGDLLDRNERANALFGWEAGVAVDVKPWRLFADARIGRDAFIRVLRDHEDLSFTAEAKRVNDAPRRCRWHFAHSFDARGELSSITALIADLSKQDEDARSLNRLRASLADAEETERSRIARELHDDLSQRLAALAMEAHIVDESLSDSDVGRHQMIPSFRSALENITSDVHSLSRKLHPTIVDDLGLTKALRSESTRRGELRKMEVRVTFHGNVVDPPRDIALPLFRIAQEALSNATRHSGAKEIDVQLSATDGVLELVVEDDGCGIDQETFQAGGGVGLNSMRERARLKGGDLVLQNRPGGGTRVVASIPTTAVG